MIDRVSNRLLDVAQKAHIIENGGTSVVTVPLGTVPNGEKLVAAKPTLSPPVPALPIEDTVHPDHIVCLEDGKSFKVLTRHLMAHYGLTPDQYRQRWGLAATYPMAAANFVQKRSEIAKRMGLGKRPTGGSQKLDGRSKEARALKAANATGPQKLDGRSKEARALKAAAKQAQAPTENTAQAA